MTYYVEPDYWVAGYAEGDATGTFIYGSGATSATGLALAGGNYTAAHLRGIAMEQSSVVAAGDLIAVFPGVTIYGNGQMLNAGGIRTASAARITALSDTKASGRIFWEMTTPASANWVEVIPQAEGSGE